MLNNQSNLMIHHTIFSQNIIVLTHPNITFFSLLQLHLEFWITLQGCDYFFQVSVIFHKKSTLKHTQSDILFRLQICYKFLKLIFQYPQHSGDVLTAVILKPKTWIFCMIFQPVQNLKNSTVSVLK